MDKLYDFSGDRLLNRPLGGLGRKVSVMHDGTAYMLKYTERPVRRGDLSDSALNRIAAEYIGSHVSASMIRLTNKVPVGRYFFLQELCLLGRQTLNSLTAC